VKVCRLDQLCLVEKWVYLGGVLTEEYGDAFVVVVNLRGSTPRRTSLGKELPETSRASPLPHRLGCLDSFSSFLCFAYLLVLSCLSLHHIG
jgi:hypothetical protein